MEVIGTVILTKLSSLHYGCKRSTHNSIHRDGFLSHLLVTLDVSGSASNNPSCTESLSLWILFLCSNVLDKHFFGCPLPILLVTGLLYSALELEDRFPMQGLK